jgi:hypothetical protein
LGGTYLQNFFISILRFGILFSSRRIRSRICSGADYVASSRICSSADYDTCYVARFHYELGKDSQEIPILQ